MIYILLLYLLIYILYSIFKNGKIINSLSQTAYIIQSKQIFCFTFWLVGIILVYPLSQISIPISLLFTIGIFGVGLTPFYRTNGKWLHYGGGILSGITSQLLVYLVNPYLLIPWIPYIFYYVFYPDDNTTFWAEIICFINIFGILLI